MGLDFETWYEGEYTRLVNTIAMVTGDRALASDAAAEACTKALVRWKRVSRMSRPSGWVYRVALNEARRRAGRQARERTIAVSLVDDSSFIVPATNADLDLWAAVARLPERTRIVVVLRYVADLTEPDIAKAMGVTRGTVATTLRRAHARLAEELGPGSTPTERKPIDASA